MPKKTIENYTLIARRVPPGDKWRLVSDEPDGPVYKSLTDTLEAYMLKTHFKGEYKLSPLESKLYSIQSKEVPPPPERKYGIYGEYSDS